MNGREQRLLALLALQGIRVRRYIAGTLWPDSTENHALASLRATICRVRHARPGLLIADGMAVGLDTRLRVDVDDVTMYATHAIEEPETVDVSAATYRLGRGDLLPGWYDDWVLSERERLQEIRIRALESLTEHSLRRGDTGSAMAAAVAAIAVDPLRESAHRALITVHLAAGNNADAVQEFRRYRRTLRHEFGLAPSQHMVELMRPLFDHRDDASAPINPARVFPARTG
ncbi:MAG: AfsR/SARP family transcriptional regulator [Jiangellaceae bacterium]